MRLSTADYAYLASEGFTPRPPPGSAPGPRWGTFVPRPLCPPYLQTLAIRHCW